MSTITLNIVEPVGPTPVDPGIDPVVPNTGLFTHGIGGPEATIIGAVIILTIAAAIVTALLYRKHKKAGRTTKLVHTIDTCKTIITSKRRITAGLTVLALLVSTCTFTTLVKNAVNATEGDEQSQTESTSDSSLTVNVSDENLTIEVGDAPVFAVLPVDITVEEATQAGYTLTAYTENTDLVSTTDGSKVIPMVTADEGELVALEDNTYGLSLNEPTSKDNTIYTTLSTNPESATVLKTIDDYTETPANDTTTIYYGFYITPNTPYGTYASEEINYKAEEDFITTLSFDGNGSDGGEAIESRIIPAGGTITLPENTYTKEGHTFIGWNTDSDGKGYDYADEANFTAIAGGSANVTLYAQWKKNAPYMQDVATWGSTLEIGDEIVAKDRRDNKEYTVARLADGNIWMTQNLDHDIGDIEGGTYTSADTDIKADWTPASTAYTRQTDDTTWAGSITAPESYDPGTQYWNGVIVGNQANCEASGGTWVSGPDFCSGYDAKSSTGDSHYSLGNYYNWTAAVAMSSTEGYETDNTDMDQSICPAGWMLPKSGTDNSLTGSGSFLYLKNEANLSAGVSGNIHTTPNWFTYGGGLGGSSDGVGVGGYYWSSVVRNGGTAYRLLFGTSGNIYPQNDYDRDNGYSVRCVVRPES